MAGSTNEETLKPRDLILMLSKYAFQPRFYFQDSFSMNLLTLAVASSCDLMMLSVNNGDHDLRGLRFFLSEESNNLKIFTLLARMHVVGILKALVVYSIPDTVQYG
jgi:hypothetical protein